MNHRNADRLPARWLLYAAAVGLLAVTGCGFHVTRCEPDTTTTTAPSAPSQDRSSSAEVPSTEGTPDLPDAPTVSGGYSAEVMDVTEVVGDAADGYHEVRVDVEVSNSSETSMEVSLGCFEMRDDEGRLFSVSDGTLVGDIPPGDSLRGALSFEVDNDATGRVLAFGCADADAVDLPL